MIYEEICPLLEFYRKSCLVVKLWFCYNSVLFLVEEQKICFSKFFSHMVRQCLVNSIRNKDASPWIVQEMSVESTRQTNTMAPPLTPVTIMFTGAMPSHLGCVHTGTVWPTLNQLWCTYTKQFGSFGVVRMLLALWCELQQYSPNAQML